VRKQSEHKGQKDERMKEKETYLKFHISQDFTNNQRQALSSNQPQQRQNVWHSKKLPSQLQAVRVSRIQSFVSIQETGIRLRHGVTRNGFCEGERRTYETLCDAVEVEVREEVVHELENNVQNDTSVEGCQGRALVDLICEEAVNTSNFIAQEN
jgi:hypothetical protein